MFSLTLAQIFQQVSWEGPGLVTHDSDGGTYMRVDGTPVSLSSQLHSSTRHLVYQIWGEGTELAGL